MKPGAGSRVPAPERVAEILPEHLPKEHLSIAVFGPGEGEAIVVRLPDGSVGVVDGCREPDPTDPLGRGDPVRELLTRFEGAPDAARPFELSFVCLTHPHDDHYAGLGRLLKAYKGRVKGLWSVLHATPQYRKALPLWLELARTHGKSRPDLKNLKGLLRVLQRFDEARGPIGVKHLSHGKPMLDQSWGGHEMRIEACGPADGDIQDAVHQLIEILTNAEVSGERVSPRHDPNLTSGALVLRWGRAALLLAGDLLRGRGPHSGWQLARERIDFEVQVVNVAHHASKEAHDEELWKTMNPALAIVTPFRLAMGKQPPRPEQIETLAASSVVAITSPPEWKRKHRLSTILPIMTVDPHRNAVAVSLDAAGNITRFVLAGAADLYGHK